VFQSRLECMFSILTFRVNDHTFVRRRSRRRRRRGSRRRRRFNFGRVLILNDPHAVALTSKSKYSSSSFPDSTRVRSKMSLMTLSSESADQGLTLVHVSAEVKRILWDRVACRVCLGVV